MRRSLLTLGIATVWLVPGTGYGDALGPETTATAAMASAKKGAWSEYTHAMHPDALKKAKQIFRPLVAADESGQVGNMFFGVAGVPQYDAMSDSATFVALMVNLTKNLPAFAEAMKTAEFHIVGTVGEGKDLVHVVYRADAKVEDLAMSKMSVLSLRRFGDEWRLLLTGSLEGLAARLSQMSAGGKSGGR